ncbi:MAG TPA: hypothetical protein VFI44_13610 [Ornithinibacter sp.]|nr:hypothetical protein [Ornithinibacter sp.]
MTSVTSRIAAAALAVPLVVATASTAVAGSKWTYRSSGSYASTSWVEVGEIGGVAGNIHVGFLEARGDRLVDVFGEVTDWTCPEGVLPPVGGGHGEEPEESECVLESQRFVFADPSRVTLTVDKKLASARLVGTLIVSDHGGESQAEPPVDVTWTGIGTASRQTSYSSYTDDQGVKFTTRTSETFRQGDVEGRIGAMVFDDEEGETSDGVFGTYRMDDRGSTP